MEIAVTILYIFWIVVIALLLIGAKESWKWRQIRLRYQQAQSTREQLSEERFCARAGLGESARQLSSDVRKRLAEFGRYDPLRIYPEDDFCPSFGLTYDDDVANLVREMKWVDGFTDSSFPLEEVQSVGDFVSIIHKLRNKKLPHTHRFDSQCTK